MPVESLILPTSSQVVSSDGDDDGLNLVSTMPSSKKTVASSTRGRGRGGAKIPASKKRAASLLQDSDDFMQIDE